MSMITAIIRITDRHHARYRRSAYGTAIAFGIMWAALLIQKMYICDTRNCQMSHSVATSQVISESTVSILLLELYTYMRSSSADTISDTLLMVLPLCFLKGVKLEYGQRVLLVSTFASSICITIISYTHSAFLFLPYTSTALILAHVKVCRSSILKAYASFFLFPRRRLRSSSVTSSSS